MCMLIHDDSMADIPRQVALDMYNIIPGLPRLTRVKLQDDDNEDCKFVLHKS